MLIECPHCHVRLRFKKTAYVSRSIVVRCPGCQSKFKVAINAPAFSALLAHEDSAICRQLQERLAFLGGMVTVCRDEEDIFRHLQQDLSSVLLLDVAFAGGFPFQLLEKIKAAGNDLHKIVLLSSVYNRTAYKKQPDSLYGADAYLELHHIGDRLLPLLGELFPGLFERLARISPACHAGSERALQQEDLVAQAGRLAKLLVADIVLYHRERLEQGLESDQLVDIFSEQLAEGRRLLFSRLPAAVDLPVDFVQQAFVAVCQSYSHS